MFKISKLSDYSTGVLSLMASDPDTVHTARDITTLMHLNLPTVMKILKLLAKAGILKSQRGSTGGYTLSRAPEDINLIEIIEAIEGDIGLTECSQKESHCQLEPICHTRHNWQAISHLLYDALGQINLAQMAKPIETQSIKFELADKSFNATQDTQKRGDA